MLAEFAGTEAAARVAYKRFVEAGVSDPPQSPLVAVMEAGILGSPEFVRRCQEWLTPMVVGNRTLDEVIAAVCAEFHSSHELLSVRGRHDHTARDAAVLIARELLSEPLDALAARFGGVSRSSISEIVKRARQRAEADDTFRCHLEAVRGKLGSGVQISKLAAETARRLATT